jgi:PST family polysaccharide transporter
VRLRVDDDGPLAARAGRALGWSVASTAIGKLTTLAIGVALARVLGPAEFGTFAVAMVALLALLSVNELGVSLAIVRWPGEPDEIVPTVATLSVAGSGLVYALCYAGAPAFADLMGEPGAVPVVRLLCVCVLLDGVAATPVALLQRNFRQDRKLVADQARSWTGAGVSIALALAGHGAMSLAVGQVVGAVVGTALFAAFARSGMRFGFDRDVAARLLRFGLPLGGASVVAFAVTNVDRLVVGAVLGPVPLGIYVLAANLSNWPLTVFSQPVRAVAPATLSRLQHDPQGMRSTFLTFAGLLGGVTLPVCALLAGAAVPVIGLVYGDEWAPAAGVLPWLAGFAALRILVELCYDYVVVLARTRVLLGIQLLWLGVLVPVSVLGAHVGGAPGVAAAQAGVAGLLVLPAYVLELHRTGLHVRAWVSRLLVPLLVGAAVALGARLVSALVDPRLLAVLLSGLVAVLALALLGVLQRGVVRELRGLRTPSAGVPLPAATAAPAGSIPG